MNLVMVDIFYVKCLSNFSHLLALMVTGINYFHYYLNLRVDDSRLGDILTDVIAWSIVRSIILRPVLFRESSVHDDSGDFALRDV